MYIETSIKYFRTTHKFQYKRNIKHYIIQVFSIVLEVIQFKRNNNYVITKSSSYIPNMYALMYNVSNKTIFDLFIL